MHDPLTDVNRYQNRLVGCYLDFSALVVADPEELVVEATFFLAAPAVFTARTAATTIAGVYMHGNTYAVGGDSIRLDGQFVDGSDCIISEDIAASGSANTPKTTRASRTIVVGPELAAVSSFNFSFPELLLPEIEEVQYSFVSGGGAGAPWVQHRALLTGNTTVAVQFSAPVHGQVTVAVRQAVHGRPRPPDHLANSFSGLCLDSNGRFTADGNPVDTWTCTKGAANEAFVADAHGHLVDQNSKKCLSLRGCSGGAQLCIQSCTPGLDLWSVSGKGATAVGQVVIRPVAGRGGGGDGGWQQPSDTCLQVGPDAKVPGAKALVGLCSDPPSLTQQWQRV